MPARTLMIQGTASHVGKSVLTAAFCRWLARRGLRVAPFKAQNMALNSAVTAEGGEIGRSQAFQAAACGVEPEVAMNPVLLKPLGGGRVQVIVKGRPYCIAEGYGQPEHAALALEAAAGCLADLRRRFDVVVLEGMGSPAEINLRERDVANMRMAELADAPVLLVGDIERGGVFASLAGTMALLSPSEQGRVGGFLINKFHGDPTVLQPGLEELEQRCGVRTLGVLPWLRGLEVDEEDAVSLADHRPGEPAQVEVVVPRLPGISNFTDLAPLERTPGVRVRYVERPDGWGRADIVLLPGSRTVAADLRWLRETGLAKRIREHARAGGSVIGLCGGYQMLGRAIHDPDGIEGELFVAGLGLLDVETTLEAEKELSRVQGVSLLPGLEDVPAAGYEIHHGRTERGDAPPAFRIEERLGERTEALDGATDAEGRVWGCYLHGLFESPAFLRCFLASWGVVVPETPAVSPTFDRLADWLQAHVDVDAVLRLLNDRGTQESRGYLPDR